MKSETKSRRAPFCAWSSNDLYRRIGASDAARAWYRGLKTSIRSLRLYPSRCPATPEARQTSAVWRQTTRLSSTVPHRGEPEASGHSPHPPRCAPGIHGGRFEVKLFGRSLRRRLRGGRECGKEYNREEFHDGPYFVTGFVTALTADFAAAGMRFSNTQNSGGFGGICRDTMK